MITRASQLTVRPLANDCDTYAAFQPQYIREPRVLHDANVMLAKEQRGDMCNDLAQVLPFES
jgi:hypothetical protein